MPDGLVRVVGLTLEVRAVCQRLHAAHDPGQQGTRTDERSRSNAMLNFLGRRCCS